MATVQRANVVLEIADDPDIIQKYKDKGYDVIDGVTGAVLERAMPHDPGALQALVLDLQGQLQKAMDDLSKAKQELAKAKAEAKKKTAKAVEKK